MRVQPEDRIRSIIEGMQNVQIASEGGNLYLDEELDRMLEGVDDIVWDIVTNFISRKEI